ncbi:unnamed protein product [Nippostrongylus brasiliensis]|uniref:SCP domain-containing protein n=1 Tax=Nippostrongylus brasiliensis TaxID=27835 RepID=A0A158R3D0_NIPBR|nr:unnamed protein product [Nippostrongylus brasiliensis]
MANIFAMKALNVGRMGGVSEICAGNPFQIQTYDCSLEEAANENVKKCERQPAKLLPADTGSNIKVIDDVGLSKEAALERATGEWFSQLHKYGMDPNSVWTENATIRDCANMVHDKYKTVGCAVNICSSNGFTIIECRYGPKRLQEGNLIYEVGPPCSRCDATQKCAFGELCQ